MGTRISLQTNELQATGWHLLSKDLKRLSTSAIQQQRLLGDQAMRQHFVTNCPLFDALYIYPKFIHQFILQQHIERMF